MKSMKNKMITKTIFGIIAGILACFAVHSQSESMHEISVWGGGGLSALDYNTVIGNSTLRGGGAFGLNYQYRFTKRWSIYSGLEINFYNSKVNGGEFHDTYITNDGEYDFEFRSDVMGYIERQKASYLNIPVMVQFELPLFDRQYFYVAGGFKLGIPVSAKYTIERAIIHNTGYYPDLDIIYYDQNFMGFGTFSRAGMENNLELKLAFTGSLEAGMKWKFHQSLFLYTGAYFDYGLNDIKKIIDRRLIDYVPLDDDHFNVGCILSSRHTAEGKPTDMTGKVIPVSVGLKIRLAFGVK